MFQSTNEFHRQRHAEHTARLRAEMHEHAPHGVRRRLGSWMVAVGLRLAPDARLHRRLLDLRDAPETDVVSGCASARA